VPATPSFAEAARFWIKLGFISFGGPAGQIAIMHREVVEQRRWIDEQRFTEALNFCMLLPGPEAMQLAIYLGWKMHGTRGGLVAGLAFVVPAILLLTVLSYVYARHGTQPLVSGLLVGLKAAVIALVVQALVRIGGRALKGPVHWLLALGAFVALEIVRVPFPLIVLAAGLVGWFTAPRTSAADAASTPAAATSAASKVAWFTESSARVVTAGIALWLVPAAFVGLFTGFDSLWSRLYLFFTQAALVTFGGAYAVLGYVTQHLVRDLGWLTAEQSVAGLALAETTPGPLIIVLQFMGFMAGWNQPGAMSPAWSALLAGALTAWATFLPSFIFIFLGAPYVERLARWPRVNAALAAITAAVVGIIATLAVLLARVVLFPAGLGHAPSWPALAIVVGAGWLLMKTKVDLLWVLAAAGLAGLAAQSLA
jgi:chromate transporter